MHSRLPDMDPFTHYMAGYVLGRKFSREGWVLRVITFSSLLPDADAASVVFGLDAARSFHGTIMHSLLILPVLAFVLSAVSYAVWRRNVLKWALAGVFLHFVLDLANVVNLPSDAVFNPVRPLAGVNVNPMLGYPTGFVLWVVLWGGGLSLSLYWFARYAMVGELPWRVWSERLRALWSRLR